MSKHAAEKAKRDMKKQAKKKKRKEKVAAKLQALREQTKAKKELAQLNQVKPEDKQSLKKDMTGIYEEVKKQITNIEVVRLVSVEMYKLIDKIVSLRLDIPYITDEQRETFKKLKENSIAITDSLIANKENLAKTAIEMGSPSALDMEINTIEDYLNKYKTLVATSAKILEHSTEFMKIHEQMTTFATDFRSLIDACDLQRVEQNATEIMPILSDEEKAVFVKYFGTTKAENDKNIAEAHDSIKTMAVTTIADAASDAIAAVKTKETDIEKRENQITGIFKESVDVAMKIGDNESADLVEYDKDVPATDTSDTVEATPEAPVTMASPVETVSTPTDPVTPETTNGEDLDTTSVAGFQKQIRYGDDGKLLS